MCICYTSVINNVNHQVFDPLKLFLQKRVFRTMFQLCGNTESIPNYVVCVFYSSFLVAFCFVSHVIFSLRCVAWMVVRGGVCCIVHFLSSEFL